MLLLITAIRVTRRLSNFSNACGASKSSIHMNFVLAECRALIMSRLGVQPGLNFITWIEDGRIELLRVSQDEEFLARAILRRYRDKTFSYTDATSFVVMERLGLRDAFSFDSDFSQYGFRTLPNA
jgi:predicted nucleic acid-binding protein